MELDFLLRPQAARSTSEDPCASAGIAPDAPWPPVPYLSTGGARDSGTAEGRVCWSAALRWLR